MSISPLNEILNRFDDGMVCIVFADHDTDRELTESCYLGWFNKNRISKHIIWAGYSESEDMDPDDEDSFICSGKRISYSSEYLNALRDEMPEISKSKKGRIQAVILTLCDEKHISKETFDCYVGSDRLTVLDRLDSIGVSVDNNILPEKEMSSHAARLIIAFLILAIIGIIALISLSLSIDDSGLESVLAIRGVFFLILPIIAIYYVYSSLRWKGREDRRDGPDTSMAMVLSFLPGVGLLYLKKWTKGLTIAVMFAVSAYISYLTVTNGVETGLNSTLMCSSIVWMIMILYISCLETEYVCFKMGLDKNSIMGSVIDKSEAKLMPILLYICLPIMFVIVDSCEHYILPLILSLAFPIYCYWRIKTMWT